MNSSLPWTPAFADGAPLYKPLVELIAHFSMSDWPGLDDYQRLIDDMNITNARGKRLRLVSADAAAASGYEPRVFHDATLPIRLHDWHDFFNLLVWARFPKSKATLNQRHNEAWTQAGTGRGKLRDALTLFDESGAIVVSDDPSLIEALRTHAWHTLFWERRSRWQGHIECWVFGHAIYEKALKPYIGLTAKAVCIPASPGYFSWDTAERAAFLDNAVAAAWGKSLPAMTPLPVLGVPGWWPDNTSETFYANRHYFRP